jgi:hypothetical protein
MANSKTPSTRIDEPGDCLKVMSRKECEELLSTQRAEREHDGSVNPEECVDNPTPECEAALRPILEAQRAAAREAGG